MTSAASKSYAFSLVVDVTRVRLTVDEMIDGLYEAGCDDALLGIGRPGIISMDVIRDAENAADAVTSVVLQALQSLPGAVLREVEPDFVGVSEIADVLGCTRQNVRKLLAGRSAGVPMPVHTGSCGVWHLAPVLRWLRDTKAYEVDDALLDVAEVAMEVNAAATQLSLEPKVGEHLSELLVESGAAYAVGRLNERT